MLKFNSNINKNSSVTNTSVFEEISLEDSNKASQLSSPGKNSSFEVVQPSNTSLHEVQNSNSNKDERICSTDSLTEKNQNILPSGNYSGIHIQCLYFIEVNLSCFILPLEISILVIKQIFMYACIIFLLDFNVNYIISLLFCCFLI